MTGLSKTKESSEKNDHREGTTKMKEGSMSKKINH